MAKREQQIEMKIESSQEILQKGSLPTLPLIPFRSEDRIHQDQHTTNQHQPASYHPATEEKVIPGYNFQSLFRKKSHIRLARKKNKEEVHKKSCNMRVESLQKETRRIQKGHWTQEENKLYHWFLEIHNRHFILKHLRRTDKIFKSMASFISTREAEQCRSHHQKMEKKYGNFFQILHKLRIEYYNTPNPELLKQDLEENGYKVQDCSFVSEQDLRDGNAVKIEDQSEERKSENSVKRSAEEEESSSKQDNSLLGQNYQKGLEFKLKY